jgi:hypothetical protein
MCSLSNNPSGMGGVKAHKKGTIYIILYKQITSKTICKKITSGISALRQIKEFVERDTLVSVYNSIVRPYFTYCCEVWDVFGETQSKRLQKRQNRAARIIMNMSNDVDHLVAL